MKKHLSILFLFFFTLCFSQEEYLLHLKKNIEENIHNKGLLQSISDAEKEKFSNTKDSLYYISYKYAYLFTLDQGRKDKMHHFLTLTELLRANNNQYSVITTDVNLAMALQLEDYSQDMSFEYINKSIENEEKIKNSRSLPHLYHIKGRLYLNKGENNKAMEYFKKALLLYIPEEYLYISSMHNNFGIVYEKQKKIAKAIEEYKIAKDILINRNQLTNEDFSFLLIIKENLAHAYLKSNMHAEAKELLLSLFNENKDIPKRVSSVVNVSKDLYKIYKLENNKEKISMMVDFLKNAEKQNSDLSTHLNISGILADYYFENQNYNEARRYHLKSLKIKDSIIVENNRIMNDLGNSLNKTIIKSTNQKYDFKIRSQKTQTLWIILISVLIISSLTYFFFSINKKRKIENEINSQQKTIAEQKELILQQSMKIQEEKIRNLHLNLNIKQETAKAFLEKVKKARKSNINNPENILKELYFDLNNLINIDKKNIDITEQSSLENQNFVKKLSEKYPQLSEQELQLCIYFRLNLSAKEISMLEKISDGTVRVYKSKIKSKINLNKDENLENVLNSI